MVIELVDILQVDLIDRLTVDYDTETAANILAGHIALPAGYPEWVSAAVAQLLLQTSQDQRDRQLGLWLWPDCMAAHGLIAVSRITETNQSAGMQGRLCLRTAGGVYTLYSKDISKWRVSCPTELFRAINIPIHYIVLRLSLDAAIECCRARGGDTLSDPEPITALHKQSSALGSFERHVLLTSPQTAGRLCSP